MKQVIVIHGGSVYASYEEYIQNLRVKELTLERLHSIGWKTNLQKDLGTEFEVLLPVMPNPQNARYLEWKIWFEKLIPLTNDEVVLIGHSLGGIFLAKYLSENKFPKKIRALFLISPPYSTPEHNSLVDFNLTCSLEGFSEQTINILLYHSKDDLVVPFEDSEQYHRELLNSKLRLLDGRGHFNDEHFDDLIDDLKELWTCSTHS